MKTAVLIAALMAVVSCRTTTQRPCEDAPIDCAAKDAETNICKDPIDSVAYCPRYCGKCMGPTPQPHCRDYDHLCPTLVNSEYCAKELAAELCAKSCGLCGEPITTTTPAPTTTTEEPTTTTIPTTTPDRFTEIPDPNCQDKDPDCIELLQMHYCSEAEVVIKLCQRSCNLCPTIIVAITDSGMQPSVTTPAQGPTTVGVCMDHDDVCAEPSTADNCTSDILIQRLCPLTCGVCTLPTTAGPAVITDEMTTMAMEETTTMAAVVPSLDPFNPNGESCFDHDVDCAALISVRPCSTDPIVVRLCPVSCLLCTPNTTPSSNATAAPLQCIDQSVDCYKLQPSCSFDNLVDVLCPKTCDAPICHPATTGAPATEAPTTEAPTTEAPTTEAPTEAMTTTEEEMTTEEPTTTTEEPATTTEEETTTMELETTTEEEVTTTEEDTTTAATTAAPRPTTTTVPPPVVCRDDDPDCGLLVESFFCGTNDLIRQLCPVSCKLCVPSSDNITTPAGGEMTTPPTAQCVDYNPQCPDLKQFCNDPDSVVNRLCRVTCGTCGVNITLPYPRDPLPLTCRACVDPFCERELESVVQCPEVSPYCASRVVNNADGHHGLTKRCASKAECDRGYAGTAAGNESLCSSFDPNVIVQQPFICFFCCRNNECNRHHKPDEETIYRKDEP